MNQETEIPERSSWPFWRNLGIAVLFAVAFLVALNRINLDLSLLIENFPSTLKLWSAFAKPDWSVFGEGVILLIKTLYMAFMATALALPFAIVLSFLGAKNLMNSPVAKAIYTAVRGLASVIRSIQPIIWAIIFVVWVRTGPFPGVLALWIHSVADMTKLFSERVESIDVGPMEAIRATGAGKLLVLAYGVIPQIINPYLSFTLYRLDINVRMATIIGIVGGGGIGMRLYSYINKWNFPKAVVLTMLIVLMVWGIDYLSSRLRERIETGGGEKTQEYSI
ncbi:phosphonate ABC transporter, permease protein PhnE [Candidatus Bipolaricaulota bacterium]|nr:phosphonate ABC transporter, permease protein PhnE [Candidatus Bipolaricaulota bacterium]